MNKKSAKDKIKSAFITLLQDKDINNIYVTDIVSLAGVNRSTFYANYLDIYALSDTIKEDMYKEVLKLYKDEAIKGKHSYDYLKLFKHIKDNQIYYKTMFKLNFDFADYYDYHLEKEEALKYYGTTSNIEYHIEFFKAGITAVIKKWLFNNCMESPEEIMEIINSEYKEKNK